MRLDISTGAGVERERLYLFAVLVEEVELGELDGIAAGDGLDCELVVAVTGKGLDDSDGAGVAQGADVGSGDDDVGCSKAYGHDVACLIDCGNSLVGRGPLQLEVLNGNGCVAGLELELVADRVFASSGVLLEPELRILR